MTIVTKLSPGEYGWILHSEKAAQFRVVTLHAEAVSDHPFIVNYIMKKDGIERNVIESKVFRTKEELLASL